MTLNHVFAVQNIGNNLAYIYKIYLIICINVKFTIVRDDSRLVESRIEFWMIQ